MVCLQYYYENEDDAKKYKIDCEGKMFPNFENIETFNNNNLLDFVEEKYSSKAFSEDSPFEFKNNYIDLSNNQICKTTDMSLAPQQKFMGQLMGPHSNFNNVLIFHGLGSGKSCTSIVIGEALKNATKQRLLYAVPAPLVDQYFEEIAGEIRNGKFFSCPSFCLVKNGGKTERDFYVSAQEDGILSGNIKNYEREQDKLFNLEKLINDGDDSPETAKAYAEQQNKTKIVKQTLNDYQKKLKTKILRTFEIVSHQSFIQSIYKTGKDGQLIKNDKLLKDSALFNENGLLIIDEIQRLVSAGGIFYKKLYNAIKYYFHPKLRIALMSATPVYDNPYELALTINLLRPRIPFPISDKEFYKFFVGKYESKDSNVCVPLSVKDQKSWISDDSCIINEELIKYICSGYVSYFKGGNPNAYPYKRVITIDHTFSAQHKAEYISALKSDTSKDKKFSKPEDSLGAYKSVLLGNYESESEDKISGMYVTTQQYSNIFLPRVGETINKTIAEKKNALQMFKSTLNAKKFENATQVIEYVKTFSTKFASIIELTLKSSGPVFIFSNWLTYGVEPLAIILEACGLTLFDREDKGKGRYFLWSSDTKTKDPTGTLTKKARNTFNSSENYDGSKLKVILGTRSVMEGVSFKNVKQVHITEPWWNESRIEQIMARASRYCSHSSLPDEEQYVDVYRHYSVLSSTRTEDQDVVTALGSNYKQLAVYGIDQKMSISSIKKYTINNELERLLKSCAIDSEINQNGNIIRLEEIIHPRPDGMYTILYKNPSNGDMYTREEVPESVSFTDIYSRKFSFPNNKGLPLEFTLLADPEEKLTKDDVNADLNLKENIIPWRSEKTFKDLEISVDIKTYITNLYKNYNLLPILRKTYLNESGTDKIKFKEDTKNQKRDKLIACIKRLAKEGLVDKSTTNKIAEEFKTDTQKELINSKVLQLIYTYNLYPEEKLEELLEIAVTSPEIINEALIEVSSKSKTPGSSSNFGAGDDDVWAQLFPKGSNSPDKVDRLRTQGDGKTNDEFNAFLDKCIKNNGRANIIEKLNEIVGYSMHRDNDIEGPVEECFQMLKQLFDQCRGKCDINTDLSKVIENDELSPNDVLNILCNVNSHVKILSNGHHGTTFALTNPILPRRDEEGVYVFKIAVGIPYLIHEFYKESGSSQFLSNVELFDHQRKKVPLGSLEQYMQSFYWLTDGTAIKNTISSLVPKIVPIDNSLLTLPCTLTMMQFVKGNSGYAPDWAAAVGLPSRQEIAQKIDNIIKEAGVAHSDLRTADNLLLDYKIGPPPQVNVAVIDFGQAIPSGKFIIPVGQPDGKPGSDR